MNRTESKPISDPLQDLDPEDRDALDALRTLPSSPCPSFIEIIVLVAMLGTGAAIGAAAFFKHCPMCGVIGGLLVGFALGVFLLLPHQARLLRLYRLLTKILRSRSRGETQRTRRRTG